MNRIQKNNQTSKTTNNKWKTCKHQFRELSELQTADRKDTSILWSK